MSGQLPGFVCYAADLLKYVYFFFRCPGIDADAGRSGHPTTGSAV